jgi:isopenicillin-N epimerase
MESRPLITNGPPAAAHEAWLVNRRRVVGAILIVAVVAIVTVVVVAVTLNVTRETSSEYGFGHEFKASFFLIPRDMVDLNFGSYGACPLPTLQRVWYWQQEMERGTNRWFSERVDGFVAAARTAVARFVNATLSTLVFVSNASSGMNAVMRSLRLPAGSKMLRCNWEYLMCRNTMDYVAAAWGAGIVELSMSFPTDSATIVNRVRAALDSDPSIRVAVFDHIVSTPAFIMPVAQLVALGRERDVLVVIDGAHAVGQIPLDLDTLDPDFYFSNGHKWLLSAKGSAFLRVSPRLQSQIHPCIISNRFNATGSAFVSEFAWQGTRDFSPFLSMADAIAFRNSHGGDAAWRAHNNQLCTSVFDYLSQRWNVSRAVPAEMTASLLTVPLPRMPANFGTLLTQMHNRNIWPVLFEFAGKPYARLSCQVYNELSDYVAFADAFDQLSPPP